MGKPKEELEARLRKAGIDPEAFAELLWDRVKPRIADMLKQTKRDEVLAAALGGLAARWSFGDRECTSAQRLAEQAERLTDAIMREEEKRAH